MTRVAGIDGAPLGWAVVIRDGDRSTILKVPTLCNILGGGADFKVIAIDVPIGLLDCYEIGGRACDNAARHFLGPRRGSSVFPAPVRPVLKATSWEEACSLSRASSPHGRAVTMQTFAILSKIKEVDDLLQERHEMREKVHEVHPEVCFRELANKPMTHPKRRRSGQEERKQVLIPQFPDLQEILRCGRRQGLPMQDILDAAVACWSAMRIAEGKSRTLPEMVPCDATGLKMAIWV